MGVCLVLHGICIYISIHVCVCVLAQFRTLTRSGISQLIMNFEFKNEETDCILAVADNIILESQPGSSPEILDAATSSTRGAAGGTEGMASREGGGGERAFAMGPPPSISEG